MRLIHPDTPLRHVDAERLAGKIDALARARAMEDLVAPVRSDLVAEVVADIDSRREALEAAVEEAAERLEEAEQQAGEVLADLRELEKGVTADERELRELQSQLPRPSMMTGGVYDFERSATVEEFEAPANCNPELEAGLRVVMTRLRGAKYRVENARQRVTRVGADVNVARLAVQKARRNRDAAERLVAELVEGVEEREPVEPF